MKVFQCVQYSPDWYELRRGLPTASAADRIITAVTGKKSGGQRAYMCELAADIACLTPNFFTERQDRPKSYAMENGTNTEPEARRFYEMEREATVQQVGFCLSDCGRFGCSPDGLVGEPDAWKGGLELKCPLLKTQAEYLLDSTLPSEYRPQCHFQLIVTGLPWIDFLSYSPGLPPLLVRVEPDAYTATLRGILADFLGEFETVLKRLGLEPRKMVAA